MATSKADRVAVVVGANRGIGLALAQELKARARAVIATCPTSSPARDLRAAGIAVAILHPGYVRTDMTSGGGNVTPDESARQLTDRLEALTLQTSGTFWHANGQVLPW